MQSLIVENFISLFQKKFQCLHKNALIYANEGYCPDCGAYLKKYFYILRCAHCDIKREGSKQFDKFAPEAHFCRNCGGHEFYTVKLDKITFIDIRYAIHSKEPVKCENELRALFSQIWIEGREETAARSVKLIANRV